MMTIFLTIPVFVPTSVSAVVCVAVGEWEQAFRKSKARAAATCAMVFIVSPLAKMKVPDFLLSTM